MKGINVTEKKNLIDEYFSRGVQEAKGFPSQIGMFRVKSANQTLIDASQRPNPNPLWLTLWYECEVCCLFADSGVGKSILAVQIATHIAQSQKVLYFDFELSDKQFQLRYSQEGTLYTFPEYLYRVEVTPDSIDVENFEDSVISNIEQTALQVDAKIIIVDNLTWLTTQAEKGDVASVLMKSLIRLKKKYGWSLLILAHTPKRQLSNPITQNDLAGSKRLYNFFDSVFSIGFSAKDPCLRYVKQLKVRYGSYTHDADNVIVYAIEQTNSFLHFEFQSYSSEHEHLRERSNADNQERDMQVLELHSQGKSLREIATELGVGKSTIDRIIKKKLVINLSRRVPQWDTGHLKTIRNAKL